MIAIVAAVFVCFSLVSAMLLPRLRPSFPGRGLPFFLGLTGLVTAGMLATIVLLAGEPKEASGSERAAPASESQPATTSPSQTATQPTTGGSTSASTLGDPVAGKAVFTKAGCVGCHTLKAAGATGTVGPNLDQAKPPPSLVIDRVTHGKGAMPAFGDSGQLNEKQIRDVAAFVVSATQQSG